MKIQITNSGGRKKYQLPHEGQVSIGRDSNTCDIAINHPGLSRIHASVKVRNGKLFIKDLGSTNGIYINGEKIVPEKSIEVHPNDQVALAPDYSVVLTLSGAANGGTAATSGTQNSLRDLLRNKNEVILGRSQSADVVLNDNSVSRKHARIYTANGNFFVEDLGSTNGTFVNGKRIRKKTQLQAADTVLVGLFAYKLDEQARNLNNESAITATGIVKDYPNGYRGLQPTTIEIPYREMVALMGPSGCGKSTLLKALNGDNPPTAGTVKLFGLDLFEYFNYLKQIIGYVPQEDIVHRDLTVEDSLYFAAKLRLPKDTPKEEITERIDEVLNDLNINDPQIRGTRVGKLSGGQRKRISIAVELLTRPKVLFLDEPTSPLDPETIEDFLHCLRRLCDQGTTVIMVTHKPEDLNYVDQVIFMGTKGHLVYADDRTQFLSHFNKENIIEVYSLLSDPTVSKHWYDKWYSSNAENELQAKDIKQKVEVVNPLYQLYWLIVRYARIKVSNSKNLFLMVLQPVLIAFLIIAVFDEVLTEMTVPPDITTTTGNVGVLFLMAIAAIWFGVSNSAKEIVGEMPITKRERMFNLLLWPYLMSKTLVLLILSGIQLVIFLAILFLAYPDLGLVANSWLFLMLLSLGAIQFGLLLSTLSSSSEEVMSILPIALMPQIILAGIIQPIQNTITLFLSYFTLGRWGTEGLARIQDDAQGLEEDKPFMQVLQDSLYDISQIIEVDSFSANLMALVILSVGMLLISRIMLSNKYG